MAPISDTRSTEAWKLRSEREAASAAEAGHAGHRPTSISRPGSQAAALKALRARMKGPGGYYNIGNLIALGAGLGVQIATVSGRGQAGPGAILEAIRTYFVGSPGTATLTLAMLIFFVSGELYHRAWSDGFPPDRRCNRWGDFLSGVAAVILTAALAAFGDFLLAVASGLLLAAGKFGSAIAPEKHEAHDSDPWPKRFRLAVVASRAPAIAALAFKLAGIFTSGTAATPCSLFVTSTMLVSYLLWTRADMLLMRPPGARHQATGRKRTAGRNAPAPEPGIRSVHPRHGRAQQRPFPSGRPAGLRFDIRRGGIMATRLRSRTNLRVFDLLPGLVLAGLAVALAAGIANQ